MVSPCNDLRGYTSKLSHVIKFSVLLIDNIYPHHSKDKALCCLWKVAVDCFDFASDFNKWYIKYTILFIKYLEALFLNNGDWSIFYL